MVMEVGLPTPIEREVDILVESEIAGVPFRMAVECRGRGRKDDIGWVDCLVGKYAHLPVDKVVAVSKSGLTRAAVEKAQFHGIEIRTLQAALDADWQKEYVKIAPGALSMRVFVPQYAVLTEPPLPEDFDGASYRCFQDDEEVGFLPEVIQAYADQRAREFFQDEFGKTYQTLADLNKVTLLQAQAQPRDLKLQDATGASYKALEIYVRFDLILGLRRGTVDLFKFGRAGVSIGTVELSDGASLRTTTVQDVGDPNTRIRIDKQRKG
ncbi:MAG TPA: hypothetical protein VF789_32370 [Thermoanaerobaculia bacterium]